MLTVGQLLTDVGAKRLTDERGLGNTVRWAHCSELVDPTPWLSGGEVLLTNGLQLEGEELQREYVHRLHDRGVAALALGIGVNHATVPDAMIDAAGDLGFPIFEIPYEVPFIAVTEKVFQAIADEQNAVLRRSMAAHERLEQMVLSEDGLEAVTHAIAQLVEGTVLVFNGRVEPLVRSAWKRPLDDGAVMSIAGELQQRRAAGDRHSFVPQHTAIDGRSIALPVASGKRMGASPGLPEAWIVATKDDLPLSEYDRLVLRQGVTIVALELLRERVARNTEWRLASSLLGELASGEVAGRDLARRLAQFGLRDRVGALVIEQPPDRPRAQAVAEAALQTALRDEPCLSVVASHGDVVCALVSGAEGDALVELAERVAKRAGDETGAPLRVGVGRAVAAGAARSAYHEARCALSARVLTQRDGNGDGDGARVATHADLGSFVFLLALQDGEELRQYCQAVLGPVDGNDAAYGDELLRSLEVFLEEGGQWEKAAKRLFCHRHTLRYRMRKVEELTGRDLASPNDRTEFWLALRGRRLYE